MEKEILQKLNLLENLIKKQEIPTKLVLSFEDGCAYLNISKSWGYKLTSKRLLPFYKTGKKILFRKVELDAWLNTKRATTKEQTETKASSYLQASKKGGSNAILY